MKRLAILLLVAAALAIPAAAQTIDFTGAETLQMPKDTFLGSPVGVATNSKGHVFVFTRNGEPTITLGGSRAFAHAGSSLYEFDQNGKFVRQIGKQVYGFLQAQAVRVDAQDNIWVVDRYSSMVIKFHPDGTIAMLLGRKPESVDVPSAPNKGRQVAGAPEASGMQSDLFEGPTDVAWDKAGNIFVADGLGNARVAKFTRDGVFVKSWGSRGSENGQFRTPHSVQVDADGNVYVADHGNKRVQVFDNDGTYKRAITNVGDPEALCITPGAKPVLYVSNSNPYNDLDHGGEIYKLDLGGSVRGQFGLYVAEAGNWRVQKVVLH
jgi:DNA-binding beta-propeller fold protein YncE